MIFKIIRFCLVVLATSVTVLPLLYLFPVPQELRNIISFACGPIGVLVFLNFIESGTCNRMTMHQGIDRQFIIHSNDLPRGVSIKLHHASIFKRLKYYCKKLANLCGFRFEVECRMDIISARDKPRD